MQITAFFFFGVHSEILTRVPERGANVLLMLLALQKKAIFN